MTEKLFAEELFRAIRADDKKSFDNLINTDTGIENMRISLGRFPLLTLIYLCDAGRLRKAYESELQKVDEYVFLPEPVDAYLLLKRNAKRALRLFVFGGSSVVTPYDALAIVDAREKIVALSKRGAFDERQANRIVKIYKLAHSTQAKFTPSGFSIPAKKLRPMQWLSLSAFVLLGVFGIFLGYVSVNVLSAKYGGDGTSGNPMFISGAEKLGSVLSVRSGDAELLLTGDIVIDATALSQNDFSGVLDGDGHTLFIKGNTKCALFGTFSGTLTDIKIVIEQYDVELTADSGAICVVNTGTIEKVDLTISTSIRENIADPNPDDEEYPDVYFGCFASKNTGKITSCTLSGDISITGDGSGNMYLGGIVGVNEGVVENCATTSVSTIRSTTVDIGGIVAENRQNASVDNCRNGATLEQISDKKTWLPNVGGIVCTNEGTVTNCANTAALSSISTATEQEGENLLVVYLGGIVCNNKAKVEKCINKGDLTAHSGIFSVYVGGVVCNNSYLSLGENEQPVGAVVKDCGSIGKIKADTDKTTVAKTDGEGESEEDEQDEVENENYYMNVGGVCAYSILGSVEDSFAMVTYDIPVEKTAGGIVGACYIANLQIYASIKNSVYYADGHVKNGLRYGDKSLAELGYDGNGNGCRACSSEMELRNSEVFWE